MPVETFTLQLNTRGNGDMIDITQDVAKIIQSSEIKNGVVTIFSPSSTSGITTIEYESGCIKDLNRLFDEIIPLNKDYAHNARWGDGNGHSHVRAAILKASLTIPCVDNALTLGTWQQVIFVDFDNRQRQRRLVLQLIGE